MNSLKLSLQMRRVFYIFLILPLAFACKNENANNLTQDEITSLQAEINLLKSENLKKDSLITESITYFNEIERNLSSIELKEKEIRSEFKNLKNDKKDSKAIILEKIKYINELRLANSRKVYALEQKLDTINVAENGFKEILKRLQDEIVQKDKEMSLLQQLLEQKDKEYTKLFTEYQEQASVIKLQEAENSEISKDLNSAYYAIGKEKELMQNSIIKVTKKGFSKRVFLNDNFNESYFTKVQMDQVNEIQLEGKKVSLITDHPESSFQLVKEGKNMKLKIINAELFWKVSKYLVVVVD